MIELPLKSNLIFSKKWDKEISGFEINPVRSCVDDDNEKCVERCDEADAEAFGVYARMAEGHAEWIADWDTKEAAEAFVTLIKYVAAFYKVA